jgi:hypothetical protein
MVPVKLPGVSQAAFDNAVAKYNKLNTMSTKMKAENEADTKRDLEITGAINASADPGPGLWQRESDRINTLTAQWSASKNPQIQGRAKEAIQNSLITLLTYHPERQYTNRSVLAENLLANPAVREILGPEHTAMFKTWSGNKADVPPPKKKGVDFLSGGAGSKRNGEYSPASSTSTGGWGKDQGTA